MGPPQPENEVGDLGPVIIPRAPGGRATLRRELVSPDADAASRAGDAASPPGATPLLGRAEATRFAALLAKQIVEKLDLMRDVAGATLHRLLHDPALEGFAPESQRSLAALLLLMGPCAVSAAMATRTTPQKRPPNVRRPTEPFSGSGTFRLRPEVAGPESDETDSPSVSTD